MHTCSKGTRATEHPIFVGISSTRPISASSSRGSVGADHPALARLRDALGWEAATSHGADPFSNLSCPEKFACRVVAPDAADATALMIRPQRHARSDRKRRCNPLALREMRRQSRVATPLSGALP